MYDFHGDDWIGHTSVWCSFYITHRGNGRQQCALPLFACFRLSRCGPAHLKVLYCGLQCCGHAKYIIFQTFRNFCIVTRVVSRWKCVMAITHCLGFGYETMVSAVCLSIFLWPLRWQYINIWAVLIEFRVGIRTMQPKKMHTISYFWCFVAACTNQVTQIIQGYMYLSRHSKYHTNTPIPVKQLRRINATGYSVANNMDWGT